MSDTIENKAVKLSDLTSVTQLIKDYTDEKDTNKVDKIEGKSLLDDTEIERLKGVNNYDDTEVKENIAEVKTDVTKLSSQIDEKANKNEVFTMANMGQDIKEAMTGGSVAVVGKDTVLTENIVDKQITPEKTSFINVIKSNNLYNQSENESGLLGVSGVTTSNSNYVYTGYINVVEGKKLILVKKNISTNQLSLVDIRFVTAYVGEEVKSTLGSDTATTVYQVPENVTKVRVTITKSAVDTGTNRYGIFLTDNGTIEEIVWDEYGLIKTLSDEIDLGITVKNNINTNINNAKTEALETINKKFLDENVSVVYNGQIDSSSATLGKYISPTNGNIGDNDGCWCTDFIEIKGYDYIEADDKEITFVAKFNENKEIIGVAVTEGINNKITKYNLVDDSAYYVRLSFFSAKISCQDCIITLHKNIDTDYIRYELIPIKEISKNINVDLYSKSLEESPLYGKKVAWVGSSITQGYRWCNLINKAFNFKATNCGVGGTTMCYESSSSMCTKERLLGQYSNVVDENTGEITYTGISIPSDVEIIFIECGTNDWARNWRLGDTKEITYDEEGNISLDTLTFYGACHQFFKNATELFPDAIIIAVGTPFGKMPNRNAFENKYGLLNNQGLQSVEYGDALEYVAGMWGQYAFNMGRISRINDNNINTLVPDGLHLTTEKAYTNTAYALINALLTIKII